MSAETEFRAALVAEPMLTALVGTRVVQNGITEGQALPYVVFTVNHNPQKNLQGVTLVDQVSFSVECWAQTALGADAVADAVVVALDAVSPMKGATVLTRSSGMDADNGLDATLLEVEWWQ